MPVPEFFRFLRPTLELLSDDQSRHRRDIEATLADQFQLSAADREELIPSGRHTRLYDRTTWALTYLRQAKLIESVSRGVNRSRIEGAAIFNQLPT
jgi:restriction system protein